jgi:hypothetical protein
MRFYYACPFLAAVLAGCAGAAARPPADAATEAACRQRAEQIYRMRHPEEMFGQDTYTSSLRDAPLGTSGTPSMPTRGLSGEFERQQLLRECLEGTGPTGPTPAAPPLAAPAPPP